MRAFRYAVFSGLAVLTALAAADPPGQGDDWADTLALVTAVPRSHQWSLVDAEQRQVLSNLLGMPAAERNLLIQEGDARERGIGIFVTEQQGDLELLLSLAPLLADEELTVPYALPTAMPGEHAIQDQTVGEYLSSVYLEWFGVDVDRSAKRFDELLGGVGDPSLLVRPWIVRLRRAQGDDQAMMRVKNSIADLPERVRWAVVTLGYCNSLYTEPEARSLLSELSEGTQDSILNESVLLPDEPLFRANAGSLRELVLSECRRLLGPPAGLPA